MILVTGGTGLVGAHLLYALSLREDKIRAIHRAESNLDAVKRVFSSYGAKSDVLFTKIEWMAADITDLVALESAFKDVTHVYHVAALISFDPKDYHTMRKINIEGTANVVNLGVSNNIEKLCYVSSIATLDKSKKNVVIDESAEWTSEGSNYGYAITKYGGEMEVWRGSQEGIDVIVVNPGVILGSGFWNSGSGKMFDKMYKGFHFYSEGITGFIGVKDVVDICIGLMKTSVKNEKYVLVAENLSYRHVFNTIAKAFSKRPPKYKVSRLMSEFGWRIGKMISLFTGKPPILTKNSAKSIHNKYEFSAEKVRSTLNWEFESIDQVITTTAAQYLKEKGR